MPENIEKLRPVNYYKLQGDANRAAQKVFIHNWMENSKNKEITGAVFVTRLIWLILLICSLRDQLRGVARSNVCSWKRTVLFCHQNNCGRHSLSNMYPMRYIQYPPATGKNPSSRRECWHWSRRVSHAKVVVRWTPTVNSCGVCWILCARLRKPRITLSGIPPLSIANWSVAPRRMNRTGIGS